MRLFYSILAALLLALLLVAVTRNSRHPYPVVTMAVSDEGCRYGYMDMIEKELMVFIFERLSAAARTVWRE